jgi:hypothetical protein
MERRLSRAAGTPKSCVVPDASGTARAWAARRPWVPSAPSQGGHDDDDHEDDDERARGRIVSGVCRGRGSRDDLRIATCQPDGAWGQRCRDVKPVSDPVIIVRQGASSRSGTTAADPAIGGRRRCIVRPFGRAGVRRADVRQAGVRQAGVRQAGVRQAGVRRADVRRPWREVRRAAPTSAGGRARRRSAPDPAAPPTSTALHGSTRGGPSRRRPDRRR